MVKAQIVISSDVDVNDRDEFLQMICDQLDEQSFVIDANSLADAQAVYDYEACKQFIEENFNGW